MSSHTLNRQCLFMLAADHRWQWEEWCDEHAIPRARIAEVKELAYRAFLLARQRSPLVVEYGALLLDTQYASAAIARALSEGIAIGTPAEKAGAFPLAWAAEPFTHALAGQFVKVLVRHRQDHPRAVQEQQLDKLVSLQKWCRSAHKPLVAEILVQRDGKLEDEFDGSVRPAMLASLIRECYGRDVVPDFWKIEAAANRHGARIIDAAIAEQPGCRHIILGKAASLETIAAWFAVARPSSTAAGFAIGRSLFWMPSTEFLLGTTREAEAIARICDNYLQLIEAWTSGASPKEPASP